MNTAILFFSRLFILFIGIYVGLTISGFTTRDTSWCNLTESICAILDHGNSFKFSIHFYNICIFKKIYIACCTLCI